MKSVSSMDSIVSDEHKTLTGHETPPSLTAEATERLVRQTFAGRDTESAALLLHDALTRTRGQYGALFYYPTHAPLAQLEVVARAHITEDEAQQVFLRYQRTGRHGMTSRNERWFALPLPCDIRDHQATHLLLLGWRERPGAHLPSFRRISAQLAGSIDHYAVITEAITVMRLLRREEVTSAAVARLRDTILTRVDHNLRTPLAAIQGHAWTLWRHYERLPLEEQRDYLETIRSTSEHLSATLDRMLQLAQLTSKTIGMNKEPVSILAIARSALMDAKASHGDRVNLTLDAAATADTDDEPYRLEADPQWIRRVFDELLDNAIRWAHDGGSIRIQLSPLTGVGSIPAIECVVRDDGKGMTSEQLRHAFVAFPDAEISLSSGYFGMGLGLAICKQIISQHDGVIWAESAIDKGTSIHFVLPRTRVASHLSDTRYHDENWRSEHAR